MEASKKEQMDRVNAQLLKFINNTALADDEITMLVKALIAEFLDKIGRDFQAIANNRKGYIRTDMIHPVVISCLEQCIIDLKKHPQIDHSQYAQKPETIQ